MNKTLVIIDGNSIINRAFYALPEMSNKEGLKTNAIYGFTNMLLKIIDTYNPTHISVAFDRKAPTFRHIEFKEYKAGRKKMPDELREQFEPLKDLLDKFNIHRLEIDGYEADDIIGTVSKIAEDNGFKVYIVTGDKDAIQLASNKTTTLITKKGVGEVEEYDYDSVIEKYEMTPTQFIDLKGLMGDKSDNIPGVPGIGEKTGIKLIKEFSSIEGIFDNIDSIIDDTDFDPIYKDVLEFVISSGKVSASLLQRRFKLGYNRACRIIDHMEEQGIVGPQNGSKPRDVLVKVSEEDGE